MYYNSMYYANNDEYLTQSPQLYDTEAHDCFNIPYFFLTEILVVLLLRTYGCMTHIKEQGQIDKYGPKVKFSGPLLYLNPIILVFCI